MTWRRFLAYRRLLTEEFVLGPERLEMARQRAEEDARFKQSADALRRVK